VIGPVSALLFLAACPAAQPDSDSLGPAQVAHLPPQEAMNLNREGKALYRDGRFAEARAKYQRAKELDPDFLAPWLNLACAYAREDRFPEATEQAVALIRHAYVPGAREVMEAADLGALQIRPQELAKLKSALAQAATEWSQAAQPGFFFVGRTQPPVKLQGQGILVLATNQEIYAWLPRSGRFLPLTAEDGRVLAFVKSPDGRRIVFVRAGRLVRGAGQADLLRGLSVRQLDLASMVLGPVVAIAGDVRQLTLWPAGRDSVELEVAGVAGVSSKFQFDGEKLQPAQTIHRRFSAGVHPVVLTAAGVAPTSRVVSDAGCGFSAHDEIDGNGLPGIRISVRAGKDFFLDARYGAALDGLPFPDSVSSPSKALSPARKTR
jgi:TPR repeat